MRKLIFIFLLFPVLLYGQGIGRYPLAYGRGVSVPEPDFTILHSWDWEDRGLGLFNGDSAADYFTLQFHGSTTGDSVVSITIDGEANKVLQAFQEADEWWTGMQIEMNYDAGESGYNEVYASHVYLHGADYCNTSGGKFSGLEGFPIFNANYPPDRDEGFYVAPQSRNLRIEDYFYTHGLGFSPWATSEYVLGDSIFLQPGTPYVITQRVVRNTFVGTAPNSDGIVEMWVNGRLMFQQDGLLLDSINTYNIDGFAIASYYGGSDPTDKPYHDCYTYIGDIVIWTPVSDSVIGNVMHAPGPILPTPLALSNNDFYYDTLVTTERTIATLDYNTSLPLNTNNRWLIEAPEGETVTFTMTEGRMFSNDQLFFYNGKSTDAPILFFEDSYDTDLTNNSWTSPGVVTSTGRYLFISFSGYNTNVYARFTGNVTFNE